jgi:hypothetical protein
LRALDHTLLLTEKLFTVKCCAVQEIASYPPRPQEGHSSSLSPDQKRELVRRVVDGKVFSRSPAMRAFLTFVAEHEAKGRTDQLKEQTIGAEVLGRKPNYDPADDNIVRVRAHELRERLEKHFASEGSEEPVIITIPKGSYAPQFTPRKAPVPEAPAPAVPQPSRESSVEGKRPARRSWPLIAAAFVAGILVTAVLTRDTLRGTLNAGVPSPNGALRDFWGQFFDKPNKELRIVYADTNFALWQDMKGKSLNLGDYLSRRYLADAQSDQLREVATRRSTSPADLAISVHLATLAGEFGGQVNPSSARSASAEYFHRGNVVLIGSRRSNPWVEVFESNLDFELAQDPHSGAPLFRNRSPKPGEAAIYAIPEMLDTNGDEQREFTSYGLLALLKGCGDRGLIVLDEGLNMQATQAVGDVMVDPQRLDTFLRSIGHKPGSSVVPFEAVIQITSLPGGYNNPKVIAYRLRPPESCVGN